MEEKNNLCKNGAEENDIHRQKVNLTLNLIRHMKTNKMDQRSKCKMYNYKTI